MIHTHIHTHTHIRYSRRNGILRGLGAHTEYRGVLRVHLVHARNLVAVDQLRCVCVSLSLSVCVCVILSMDATLLRSISLGLKPKP